MADETALPLLKSSRFVPVTIILIALCAVIASVSNLGESLTALYPFFIAGNHQGFQSILSGEVWRLITPIFIHFGIVHLVFNMLWLWDLGSALERTKGHLFVAIFVLIVGVTSNLAQFIITENQFFGGMSGVIYGFLGYIWMQARCNPRFGITLHKQTTVLMLGWFVICWLGLLGPIANWAHTFGLGMGIAMGCIKPRR